MGLTYVVLNEVELINKGKAVLTTFCTSLETALVDDH
jgi:hypothetical protein